MDNKFLEEADKIVEAYMLEERRAYKTSVPVQVGLEERIATALQSLSSKHKEDVRALRDSLKPEKEKSRDIFRGDLYVNSAYAAGYDGCHSDCLAAFDSTLKERGISL